MYVCMYILIYTALRAHLHAHAPRRHSESTRTPHTRTRPADVVRGGFVESDFQQIHPQVITVGVIDDLIIFLPELLRDGYHLIGVRAPGDLPLLLVWLSLSLNLHAVPDIERGIYSIPLGAEF